ncbi:sigma-70 family RNA polymerase sigma factor [Anaerofustis sp.]|uniref:RNA polymerase sigma factor n=1 Tax=Anaerofustis sp. TaxID=1872517 RepID=UPI0025C72E24|nr:sigma-70 family RNA polymerase sigma factor [Anaerofustis sp.]
MDDSKIIDLFFSRSENAIIELSKKYGKIAMKTSYNILSSREDAEECVNDSYLSVWRTVPPKQPNPLITYLLRFVRTISLDKYKYRKRLKRNNTYDECLEEIGSYLTSNESTEDEIDAMVVAEAINDFLGSLDGTTQMIFVRRYWYLDSYKELSRLSGMKETTIRVKLLRTREDLMKFLKEKEVV